MSAPQKLPAPSAGTAADTPLSAAGSLSPAPAARGRRAGAGETVEPSDEPQEAAEGQPGAAGRKAWKAAISGLHARQARGRVQAKVKRGGPGMVRKMPGGRG